jgi:hypothetical protein
MISQCHNNCSHCFICRYKSRQRMWRNFDSFNRLMETHPHMRDEFINHLKELEDSND